MKGTESDRNQKYERIPLEMKKLVLISYQYNS